MSPFIEDMRKSWQRAPLSQKITRVGIVGGLLGGLVYLFTATPRPAPPRPRELPAEPVERDPALSRPPRPSPRAAQVRGWRNYR